MAEVNLPVALDREAGSSAHQHQLENLARSSL